MCIHIDSRCVLLNILQVRESTDLSDLLGFAVALKKKVHNAYVDISDASVFSVLEDNPDIFKLTGSTVSRVGLFVHFTETAFLDRTVNRHLEPDVQESLHECATSMGT